MCKTRKQGVTNKETNKETSEETDIEKINYTQDDT